VPLRERAALLPCCFSFRCFCFLSESPSASYALYGDVFSSLSPPPMLFAARPRQNIGPLLNCPCLAVGRPHKQRPPTKSPPTPPNRLMAMLTLGITVTGTILGFKRNVARVLSSAKQAKTGLVLHVPIRCSISSVADSSLVYLAGERSPLLLCSDQPPPPHPDHYRMWRSRRSLSRETREGPCRAMTMESCLLIYSQRSARHLPGCVRADAWPLRPLACFLNAAFRPMWPRKSCGSGGGGGCPFLCCCGNHPMKKNALLCWEI